ncbi:MAG: hypothetical protein IJN03_02405 [Bacilli bacterium]|nr:hypothetical protein [Bacilli bacterium]
MRNKKVVISIISIVAVLLVIIGVTYAYWLVTKTQTNSNIIGAGCLDISLSGEKNDIELQDQFPLSDEDGMKLVPYEFTVTNNCTTGVDYHINLESVGEESTAIKASSLKAVIDQNTPKRLYDYVGAEPTFSGAYESYTLLYGTLASASDETTEDTVTYKLRIWIDADAPISEQNKSFRSKISVSVGQHITSQGNTLASLILDDAEENNYLKNETPNFGTATVDGEYGLYSAEDDYGTSYYFRGDVTNNYVQLGSWKEANEIYYSNGWTNSKSDTLDACIAGGNVNYPALPCSKFGNEINDPMYWRIVRINGDGTIRLVYDGVEAKENGLHHSAIIKNTAYGNSSGYTYMDNDVKTDSVVKAEIDAWYNRNLYADYNKYIADRIFCNNQYIDTANPSLVCTEDESKYSVDGSYGNGLLTHPLGLLTVDEVVMSGSNYIEKNNSYLYRGVSSGWTMTKYENNYVFTEFQPEYRTSTGAAGDESARFYGPRPVINIKADVLFGGNGTIDSPYQIVS